MESFCAFIFVFWFLLEYYAILSHPLTNDSTDVKDGNKVENINIKLQNYTMMVWDTDDVYDKVNTNHSKTRIKRQSGAGKFAEASKMPQIKLLRLFLQMFKNSWDSSYVGGTHPLHHNIPKVFVALYKEKVVEFFIPDVGDDQKG